MKEKIRDLLKRDNLMLNASYLVVLAIWFAVIFLLVT